MNMFNIQKELNEYTYSKNETEEEQGDSVNALGDDTNNLDLDELVG